VVMVTTDILLYFRNRRLDRSVENGGLTTPGA
jgi:hypothetical protein